MAKLVLKQSVKAHGPLVVNLSDPYRLLCFNISRLNIVFTWLLLVSLLVENLQRVLLCSLLQMKLSPLPGTLELLPWE